MDNSNIFIQTNPELARAALNDPARFSSMVQQLEQNRRHAEQQRMDMVKKK